MIDPDDIRVGDEIVSASFGPLTIADTVRWAGVQENWEPVHWDRDSVRKRNKLRTFIASGSYRQALLVRALTDWLGLSGSIKKLSIRHLLPTFEGDMQKYVARVSSISKEPNGILVICDLVGRNQNEERMLTGSCTLWLSPLNPPRSPI